MKLRLGTRGSRLAALQSNLVADRLRALGHEVALVSIVTTGDLRPPDAPFGEGVFVTAIAAALRAGEVDLAVHSAKDVPLEGEADLVLAAFPERADPRDVIVDGPGRTLEQLPPGALAGTDSPRRTAFLLACRPDLRVRPLHGNVDTRLRRLDGGEADFLVLAAAGLDRLGAGHRVTQRLDPGLLPPAPGQGALVVQARAGDSEVLEALAPLDVAAVRSAVELERAVLAGAGGGCRAPVGALAVPVGEGYDLLFGAAAADGSRTRMDRLRLAAGDLAGATAAGRGLRAVGAW